MTDQATFRLRELKGVPLIEVVGELDVANIDEFRAFVRDMPLAASTAAVIVTVEHVSYLDSHALQALVELSKRLHTNRRQLLVVAPRETPPGRLLRTANLELALKLFETTDDARLSVS